MSEDFSVVFKAPRERVFNFMTDFENLSSHSLFIKNITIISKRENKLELEIRIEIPQGITIIAIHDVEMHPYSMYTETAITGPRRGTTISTMFVQDGENTTVSRHSDQAESTEVITQGQELWKKELEAYRREIERQS